MKTRIFVTALVAALTAFSQDSGQAQLDKARESKIIRKLKKKYDRWENTRDEYILVTPLWKDIAKIRVQWGLNRDPVPDPFVYYATADNKIHVELCEALRSMKYVPRDTGEALHIAGMLVQSANPHALVVKHKDDIKNIPEKVARDYKVKPATVTSPDSRTYEIVMFSYQAPQQGGFTRHFRIEELKKHTISLHKGKVKFDSESLMSALMKKPR
jgi:hypothetical protein